MGYFGLTRARFLSKRRCKNYLIIRGEMIHLCKRNKGHRGAHECPCCGNQWTTGKE